MNIKLYTDRQYNKIKIFIYFSKFSLTKPLINKKTRIYYLKLYNKFIEWPSHVELINI